MKPDLLDFRSSNDQKNRDISICAALILCAPIGFVFVYLSAPQKTEIITKNLVHFFEVNQKQLFVLLGCFLFNGLWLGNIISRFISLHRQGAKLEKLAKTSPKEAISWRSTLVVLLVSFLVLSFVSEYFFLPAQLSLLPIETTPLQWSIFVAVTVSFTVFGLIFMSSRFFLKFPISRVSVRQLPLVPNIKDGIILGSVHESVEEGDKNLPNKRPFYPSWLIVGLKGLTGNLFISGVIGSGKSQILLQFLCQILTNFRQRPCLLAIDPKRTFVLELKKIIEKIGMSESLLWVSLTGEVRFNPIWREKMLKDSSFTTVANTLKLASINFLGSSGDSRFWEQSSFNLLKGALVYCAAKYEYFTFKELYSALLQARDEGLAAELVDCLSKKSWDEEEQANIEMAISYFKDEFSQMDQKIRTSILATATGFLNEFLEYRVSKILSPKREEISLFSIAQAIRDGKLICLNIENDALARSIGTLFKLLYQEAILDRVTHPNHASARYAVLVMDEYQDVVTSGGGTGLGDDRFLAKGREAKAITIVATQSVSSLENAIRSEAATRELLQNFRSRIFGNSTDPKTIRLFQEPMGTEERERNSRSISENAHNPTRDFLFGGFDTKKSSLSESISTHSVTEFAVTAKEFARLRTFESFSQIFDGLETRFEKLYLKPYFLKDIRTPHRVILDQMRKSAMVTHAPKAILLGLALLSSLEQVASADILFPNICSVVKTPEFQSCLGFSVSGCMCGWPIPRPCAQISYHVPQTFIEVWPNSKDSFFTLMPGALAQLQSHRISGAIPFGADDDLSSYAFQARSIPIPFASMSLAGLPCGETRTDKVCFDLMSEDLGKNWNTGSADSLQPQFLAWSLAPQLCMLKGTATGIAGIEPPPSAGMDSGGCSYPLGGLPKYPPSPREACNGWGLFFPRSGVYEGGARSIAALMVASRLKSLGVEVAHTIPGGPGETWQMIYPQSSSCFTEGQNPGVLELGKGIREERRAAGKPNGYLFVVWKKVSCCQDIPTVATSIANIVALSAACVAVPGGGT